LWNLRYKVSIENLLPVEIFSSGFIMTVKREKDELQTLTGLIFWDGTLVHCDADFMAAFFVDLKVVRSPENEVCMGYYDDRTHHIPLDMHLKA
jgi:hypothetical protein